MTIKRFGLGREYAGNTGSPAITELVDGEYVRHADYQIELSRIEQMAIAQTATIAGLLSDLDEIYEVFNIESDTRDPHILLNCIEHLRRRATCLTAIEQNVLMITRNPHNLHSDEDTEDGRLPSWNASPDAYARQFRAALDCIRPAQEKPLNAIIKEEM